MKNDNTFFSKPSDNELRNLVKLYKTEEYLEAEKISLSITKEFPKFQFTWKLLAAIYKKIGKINDSLVASQKAVELDPNDIEIGRAHV